MFNINVDKLLRYAKDTDEEDSMYAKEKFIATIEKHHNIEKALAHLLYDECFDDYEHFGKWCPSLISEYNLENYGNGLGCCLDCAGNKSKWIKCWERAIENSDLLKRISIPKKIINK